jgi:pyruvate,water dikinase
VEVRGIPYADTVAQEVPAAGPDGRRLAGTGCSPGIATGEALIVMHPHAGTDAAGRILITETTDPAWAFLMVSAAGLVAERGSLLSHTAIIGRELGIPTVVGVAGATRLIADGARLQVNGGTGEIVILA